MEPKIRVCSESPGGRRSARFLPRPRATSGQAAARTLGRHVVLRWGQGRSSVQQASPGEVDGARAGSTTAAATRRDAPLPRPASPAGWRTSVRTGELRLGLSRRLVGGGGGWRRDRGSSNQAAARARSSPGGRRGADRRGWGGGGSGAQGSRGSGPFRTATSLVVVGRAGSAGEAVRRGVQRLAGDGLGARGAMSMMTVKRSSIFSAGLPSDVGRSTSNDDDDILAPPFDPGSPQQADTQDGPDLAGPRRKDRRAVPQVRGCLSSGGALSRLEG